VLLNTSFGYDHIKSQLMTVPVYLVAVVAVIVFAYLSDRQQARILYYVIAMTIALIGCIISFKSDKPKVRYGASFLAVPGVFAAAPCHIALGSQNLAHKTKRGTGLAILMTFSAIVPTTSSALFPTNEAPRYPTGHKVCISCSVLAIAFAIAYGYVLKWENDKKRQMRESGEAERLTREELIDLGDKSPYFEYRF
jgi:sugar phosphate permease